MVFDAHQALLAGGFEHSRRTRAALSRSATGDTTRRSKNAAVICNIIDVAFFVIFISLSLSLSLMSLSLMSDTIHRERQRLTETLTERLTERLTHRERERERVSERIHSIHIHFSSSPIRTSSSWLVAFAFAFAFARALALSFEF